jgi:hypothetical protein
MRILEAVGNALPISIGLALSPFVIATILIILMTGRARTNAPAFLVGWVLGFLIVGLLVDLIPEASDTSGWPKSLPGVVRIALGLILLLLAIQQWRKRPAPGEKVIVPKFLTRLDDISVIQSSVTGFLLSALHPKNLPLIIAGVEAIRVSELDEGGENVAFAIFTTLSSLTIVLPMTWHFLAKEKAEATFGHWKDWLIRHNGTVLILLLLLLGMLLIGRGMRMLAI